MAKSILIVYSTGGGNTKNSAEAIAEGVKQAGGDLKGVKNVTEISVDELTKYDALLIGEPTWGDGEHYDDYLPFDNAMKEKLVPGKKLAGKQCAVFAGCDRAYAIFGNAVDMIEDRLMECGAEIMQQGVKVELEHNEHSLNFCKKWGHDFVKRINGEMPKQPYIPRMSHDDADRVKGIDPASRKKGAAAATGAPGAVKAAVTNAKQPGTVRAKPEAKANLLPYRATVAPARTFERKFTPDEIARRRFVQAGTYGGIALISAAVAAYFFPGGWQVGFTRNGPYFSIGSKNVLFEPPTEFKIGTVDEYQVGKVDVRWQTRYRVWVVREPNKLYVGLLVCTHLGCTPDWKEAENKFKCPCHGSGYYQDGVNFEGPAPRPMEHCDVRIDPADGQIVVNKGRTYREDKGEWVQGGTGGGAYIAL